LTRRPRGKVPGRHAPAARKPASAAALALLLAGCAVGPDYRRPAVEMPAAWVVEAPFRASAPGDTVDKGLWWQRFGDPTLDALEAQAVAASPTLAAASARLTQAQAQVAAAESGLLP